MNRKDINPKEIDAHIENKFNLINYQKGHSWNLLDEELINFKPRGSITYPFYNCKHKFLIFYVDQFGTAYKCYKCGKVKNIDWNGKITYF